jgi:cytochrome P450
VRATGLLANGLVALLGHPEQTDRLRREPEVAKSAVNELLRYDAPVQMTYGRTAVDDLVVCDVSLHAGQRVIAILGGANRDPRVFTAPNDLILDRDEGLPLSFGAGIHHCLGAALARLEGQVMLPKLLQGFPRLTLAGEPERRLSNALRGYTALPVSLGY